ncbi:ankyrin repeat domain-containing protein 29-like isoform X2 [Watersipora subatra]
MERRYCDVFRAVDEDAYLRDFIRAVEHKNLAYVQFVFPIIKEQQTLVSTELDDCGHYIELTREDTRMYDRVLEHGFILAAHHGYLPIANYLLDHGVNVNAQNEAGATALIKACERGHKKVVQTLLEHGADVNQTDLVGSTALQWVTRMSDQLVDILKLLLSHDGINVNQRSHKRARTALHCAAENDLSGQMCRGLLDKLATVNIVDNEGITPLHLAAERGFVWNVRVLLEYGAHVNMQTTQFGSTALHIAMAQGHVETAMVLLASGADISIKDSCDETALEGMRKYSRLASTVLARQYDLLEDYVASELSVLRLYQVDLMKQVFNVLCELIKEEDHWYKMFMELFQCSHSNGDKLEEATSSLPVRTSEASLSILLLHLFHVWLTDFPQTATFWILMRALRDYGMSPLADKMINKFTPCKPS